MDWLSVALVVVFALFVVGCVVSAFRHVRDPSRRAPEVTREEWYNAHR